MDNRIIDFYYNQHPDSGGRFWDDVLSLSDSELEQFHDYIQWLFPLDTVSSINPNAPILTDEIIYKFESSPILKKRLCISCKRMLNFYGFICDNHGTDIIRITWDKNYKEKFKNWLKPHNHNYLRFSRILKSLKLLGLSKCSRGIFQFLDSIALKYPDKISKINLEYWKETQKK